MSGAANNAIVRRGRSPFVGSRNEAVLLPALSCVPGGASAGRPKWQVSESNTSVIRASTARSAPGESAGLFKARENFAICAPISRSPSVSFSGFQMTAALKVTWRMERLSYRRRSLNGLAACGITRCSIYKGSFSTRSTNASNLRKTRSTERTLSFGNNRRGAGRNWLSTRCRPRPFYSPVRFIAPTRTFKKICGAREYPFRFPPN